MKCPTCGENTPDSWEELIVRPAWHGGPKTITLDQPHGHYLSLDWMKCANEACQQVVVRAHDTHATDVLADGQPELTTETWMVHPRHRSRSLDPLVPEASEALARDYAEAVAILDISHRMAAVLARSILADLLEAYAGFDDFRLVDRVDKFIADDHRPTDLRQDLHYLREIADLSAHTKTNDQFERIEISRDEAEWTLTIIERLFDHFIVSQARSAKFRAGIDQKLKAANRQPIQPLPLKGKDGEESA